MKKRGIIRCTLFVYSVIVWLAARPPLSLLLIGLGLRISLAFSGDYPTKIHAERLERAREVGSRQG